MRVVIEGFDLPGRVSCGTQGELLGDVHVGVQVRKDPHDLFSGDADAARWEVEVELRQGPEGVDFFGPAVHGKRGGRFLYLTWGNVTGGDFEMFRRAKLMLHRVDEDLVARAESSGAPLVGRVSLTDEWGGPRCARVDPPAIEWSVAD